MPFVGDRRFSRSVFARRSGSGLFHPKKVYTMHKNNAKMCNYKLHNALFMLIVNIFEGHVKYFDEIFV